MKFLHLLTLSLHFAAMQLLVGGTLIASLWAFRARTNPVLRETSGAVAGRLPIIMTYVINLGVPPLLFAQVLYGRALYSSSVLIGAYWIAVIFLLMISYTGLYIMSSRSISGKGWGLIGLISLAVTMKIGYIYTNNMTLMLRPEVWNDMYRASGIGLQFSSGDATILPRYLFMMAGGLTVGGAGLMLLGIKKTLSDEAAQKLRTSGAAIALVGVLVQAGLHRMIIDSQPEAVQSAIDAMGIWSKTPLLWLATATLTGLAAASVLAVFKTPRGWIAPTLVSTLAFLNIGAWVLHREAIRDATLLQHGFDVWDRQIATNWIVVGAFLATFVAGLATVGWLISVVARAKDAEESYG